MGILSKLFAKNKEIQKNKFNVVELFSPFFSDSHNPKLNDTFMSCVNAHARHISKFRPLVIYKDKEAKKPHLKRLLQLRPNPLMNASTFYEKIAYGYFVENNAFIYIEYDYSNFKEPIKALWVLDPTNIDIKITEDNKIYLKFKIKDDEVFTDLENIIHIARNVNNEEFFGEKNNAIKSILKVMNTNYEGIEQAIKTSAFLRFIIQTSTPASEPEKKRKADQFAKTYLSTGSTGVGYIDTSDTIIPMNNASPKYANAAEMKHFEEKIYKYLGINEKIITAAFNEDEWQSYYESTIEPLAIKLEQELTYKLFTEKEIEVGNEIRIDSNRLQTASLKTRIQVAQLIQKLPVYKPNSINKLLFMPETESGDKEFSTLNYVQADKQNEYQGVDDIEENEEENLDE